MTFNFLINALVFVLIMLENNGTCFQVMSSNCLFFFLANSQKLKKEKEKEKQRTKRQEPGKGQLIM